ncbi:MAG: prepilin-type N-terminal cleavage/methylation domain-containing protein, partial [candidate division NC10 bacterium]
QVERRLRDLPRHRPIGADKGEHAAEKGPPPGPATVPAGLGMRHLLLSGRSRRGGFTLIDVLVAAVLLAVAILFVSTIFPMGTPG